MEHPHFYLGKRRTALLMEILNLSLITTIVSQGSFAMTGGLGKRVMVGSFGLCSELCLVSGL
jgi:hypothetical protein